MRMVGTNIITALTWNSTSTERNDNNLASTVLANVYNNLTSLTIALVNASDDHQFKVLVAAPLSLFQVCIWERFPFLIPRPILIGQDEPRLA